MARNTLTNLQIGGLITAAVALGASLGLIIAAGSKFSTIRDLRWGNELMFNRGATQHKPKDQ